MDYTNWESLADNRLAWKQELSSNLKKGGLALNETSEEKRRKTKESPSSNVHPTDDFDFTCQDCKRHCKSRMGLYSHTKRCLSVESMDGTNAV